MVSQAQLRASVQEAERFEAEAQHWRRTATAWQRKYEEHRGGGASSSSSGSSSSISSGGDGGDGGGGGGGRVHRGLSGDGSAGAAMPPDGSSIGRVGASPRQGLEASRSLRRVLRQMYDFYHELLVFMQQLGTHTLALCAGAQKGPSRTGSTGSTANSNDSNDNLLVEAWRRFYEGNAGEWDDDEDDSDDDDDDNNHAAASARGGAKGRGGSRQRQRSVSSSNSEAAMAEEKSLKRVAARLMLKHREAFPELSADGSTWKWSTPWPDGGACIVLDDHQASQCSAVSAATHVFD